MKFQFLVMCSTMSLAAGAAQAQNMKPGLWNINSKIGGNAQMEQAQAQMLQQLAALPPDQRQMVEAMLAKQGVGLGAAAGGGTSIKVCITKEMAERNELPTQTQGDCKTSTSERTSSGMKIAFTCSNPPSSGEGRVSFISPEAYSVKMSVTSSVQGPPQRMNIDLAGQWQGAECGAVKPLAANPN